MTQYRNFIAGRFVESASAGMGAVNPATGQVFAEIPAASPDDVIAAVEHAAQAQASWGALPAIQRGDALRRLADCLERHADAIGGALALESGKSLDDARGEVIYGAELTRYHAEWARRLDGEIIESDNPARP